MSQIPEDEPDAPADYTDSPIPKGRQDDPALEVRELQILESMIQEGDDD